MAKFVVEFSPPEKIKSEPYDVTDSIITYRLVLAPFQKQTQVEFNNIKLKETAIRLLTVVNPLNKPGEFVLPPPSDGVYFDVYKFTLEPNSQCKLSITWQPSEYGNMRKLIKIEQVDSNKKYDFVILGNCYSPAYTKLKGINSTSSKPKYSDLSKNQLSYRPKKIRPKKTKVDGGPALKKMCFEENSLKSSKPIRRETFIVVEKENFPLCRNTLLSSPERSIKRPDQRRQDHVFNNHFNFTNLNKSSSSMSDDSFENPKKKMIANDYSLFNDICFTPLKSTENLLSPFNISNQSNNFDVTDGPLAFTSPNSMSFEFKDALDLTHTLVSKKSTKLPVNLCNMFMKTSDDELNKSSTQFELNAIKPEPFLSSPEGEHSSFELKQEQEWEVPHTTHHRTMITWSGMKPKRPFFTIKNSPHKIYNLKTSMSKNKLKQYSLNQQTTNFKSPKQDKFDQYLKCLTNPELRYHNYAEDPFLKMSQYYEEEWLNRQESDMIRWLNALLMPTDKLIDEEQSDDLEQAALVWVEASKASHQNKPMLFATQKDLFVSQIYRQSPQQWSALRKASTNLITSTSVSTVLSKLTVSIEKDLITVRDDRQIHLDLSLKKKILDLLKCYNPLWLRIGLEAIYGQIIHVKAASNDLDGIGWFIRKHLFNNDFVKKKFTRSSILKVNSPSYNTAMKNFILRKMFMLIYFLDRAKEQQLIRHNPSLFKTNSPYKSSYNLLMGFCADTVTAHGDIVRRLRIIGYNLTHKQTHLDEVNYAVKSLNDLRDGTRITRVVEILFKGNTLSQKLRLPAISKLQKIHNVKLAITRISEHISIEGDITTKDIVSGHREKILSLFWQIIYKYLTPRYNKAATKIQNWWRNSSIKLVILKRIRAKQIARRHLAASKIQSRVRGYLTRKQWPCLKAKLTENREMLHMASTRIKIYLKDKLKLLTEERKRFIILRRTVIFVQKKFRAKIAMINERHKFLKIKQSTIMIQKIVRGFILKKQWPRTKDVLRTEKTKRIAAVNIIKRVLRKNLPLTKDHLEFLKIKQAVLYIESLFLANKLMKLQFKRYVTLRNKTLFVQQKFRANSLMKKVRKYYLKIKHSILLIQKVFRGYMVRKYWPGTKISLMSEKTKRIDAINLLKLVMRRNLPPTRDRLEYVKLKQSVLYVENLYLANRLMTSQLEYYVTLKNTIIFVQRKFRANIWMKRERENYLIIKRSVLVIQRMFRGAKVRKYWPCTKKHLTTEKKKRVNAINIVKRALRRNLPETQDRSYFVRMKSAVLFIQRMWRASYLMKTQRKWYLTSQYATVNIQRIFRAKKMLRMKREEYLKFKSSTVLIQKIYRGFSARKRWPKVRECLVEEKRRKIEAANIIKCFLRKSSPPTRDRLNYEKLRHLIIKIQRKFRANIEMRLQRKEFQILKNSAIVLQRRFRAKWAMEIERNQYMKLKIGTVMLQSVVRGYLVRKHWPEMRAQLENNRTHLNDCADVVKRTLRKHLPLTKDRLQFLKLKTSVVVVQRRFRAKCEAIRCKDKYLQLKTVVFGLQSTVRGYLFRRHVWPALQSTLVEKRLKLAHYSNIIKRFLRRCLPMTKDRITFLKLKLAVTKMQRRFRANCAMKIQRHMYVKTKATIIQLQSSARGFLFRRLVWTSLKTELTSHRQLLIQCANIIKRTMRNHLADSDRSQFLALRRAVIVCQRRFRTCIQSREYQKLRAAVLVVQLRFRANIAARLQRIEYLRLRSSVVILQKYYRVHRANHAAIILQAQVRGFLTRRKWPQLKNKLQTEYQLAINTLQERNNAASKIQATFRGFFLRKKFPEFKDKWQKEKRTCAAILIQALWRGYCVRKIHQCRRQTIKLPMKGAPTLARRYNNIVDMLNKQKRNQYSYKELVKVFWNLDTCTVLSKELCSKTAKGTTVDDILNFLQNSNQSQPSIEAREPAIRVLINLLRYAETSQLIWIRTVNASMIKEFIKMMKTSCGKFGVTMKVYCSIATWIWIALQDPKKKQYIKNVPNVIIDFKYMRDTLIKKNKMRQIDKKAMILPSTRPTWYIGSKCQKCFESDLYATVQVCKMLNIKK